MKDHITVWKIHLKIWLAVLILLVLVIGVIERARAMTSDPAAISFCTVSGAISYPSYTTNEGFWWRCWTNQELYNYLKAYYQAKGGKNGTWMSATGWISRYFFPVAYATGGDISLNMNLTIGGMQNDGASALAYQQALTAALGSGGVLVVNQASLEQEMKWIQDYDGGAPADEVAPKATCMNTTGPGSASQTSATFNGTYWVYVVNCINGGSCAGKTCVCCFDGTLTGHVQWTGSYTFNGSQSACAGGPSIDTWCNQQNTGVVANGGTIAGKGVDNAVDNGKIREGMAQDASKGATTSSAANGVNGTGGSNNQGLSTSQGNAALDATGRAVGSIGSTGTTGTTGSTGGTGTDTSTYTGGDGSGHSAYNGTIPSGTVAGFQSGISTSWNDFSNTVKGSSLFTLGGTNLGSMLPGGSWGNITINGGNTFGTATWSFSHYATALNALRGTILAICSFAAFKIVIIKGGGV